MLSFLLSRVYFPFISRHSRGYGKISIIYMPCIWAALETQRSSVPDGHYHCCFIFNATCFTVVDAIVTIDACRIDRLVLLVFLRSNYNKIVISSVGFTSLALLAYRTLLVLYFQVSWCFSCIEFVVFHSEVKKWS